MIGPGSDKKEKGAQKRLPSGSDFLRVLEYNFYSRAQISVLPIIWRLSCLLKSATTNAIANQEKYIYEGNHPIRRKRESDKTDSFPYFVIFQFNSVTEDRKAD